MDRDLDRRVATRVVGHRRANLVIRDPPNVGQPDALRCGSTAWHKDGRGWDSPAGGSLPRFGGTGGLGRATTLGERLGIDRLARVARNRKSLQTILVARQPAYRIFLRWRPEESRPE